MFGVSRQHPNPWSLDSSLEQGPLHSMALVSCSGRLHPGEKGRLPSPDHSGGNPAFRRSSSLGTEHPGGQSFRVAVV